MASVRRRDPNDPKSPWVCDYKDCNGARKLKTFRLMKQAEAFKKKVEQEIASGEHVADSESATVAFICDLFVKHAEIRLKNKAISRATYNKIDLTTRVHIAPVLGKVLWTRLTAQHLEEWFRSLIQKGAALASRRGYLETFRQIESFAINRGYAGKRVVERFKAEHRGGERVQVKTLTMEEMGRILAAAEERVPNGRYRTHLMFRLALHLATFCGLRRGEIFGLTVESVDLDRRILRVRHSFSQWGDLKAPKTNAGRRDVPMPHHVAEMMRHWMQHYYSPNDRRIVFVSCRREGSKQNTAYQATYGLWKQLLTRMGMWGGKGDRPHFHAMRHFNASWLIQQGMALPDVASQLGHAKFDVTLQTYAHSIVGGNHRQEIVDRAAPALLGPPSPIEVRNRRSVRATQAQQVAVST